MRTRTQRAARLPDGHHESLIGVCALGGTVATDARLAEIDQKSAIDVGYKAF